MDSAVEDDPTLPLDFERSTNMARFKEALAAGNRTEFLDSSSEFSEGLVVKSRPIGSNQDESTSAQTTTMKDYEYQIGELKKENFGLKLRIYFLEERMDDTPEDIFKANIELKVTVEKFKKELSNKQELLVKASAAVETLAQQSENQIKQLNEEHNNELQEIREGYEVKLKEMEKELTGTKQDLEDLADKLEDTRVSLIEKDREIGDLKEVLDTTKEKHEPKEYEQRMQDSTIKIKQLEEELNAKDGSLEELKERVKKTERLNRGLRNQLHDKEVEHHTSSRSLDSSQVKDLEQSLSATRESAHAAKMKWLQSFEEHSEVVTARDAMISALQSALTAKDLELERLIQALSGRELELQQLNKTKTMLVQNLDDMRRQKDQELAELTGKLQNQAHAYTEKVDQLDEKCQQMAAGMQAQLVFKDKTIDKVAKSNSEKDKLISDFVEALREATGDQNSGKVLSDSRDNLVEKLKDHLQEKDVAVESALDEKLRSFEDKEMDLRQLRHDLRERDRLIEKMNSAVIDAEERMQLLTNSCKDKDDVALKLKASLQEQQKAQQETLDSVKSNQLEKEAVIQKLKNSLKNKERELKELRHFIHSTSRDLSQSSRDDGDSHLKELTDQLKEKEKLFEGLFQERSRVSSVQEANTQRLKTALRDKDNTLKEASENLSRVLLDKNGTIQRLQQLLTSKDHELQSMVNSKAWATQEHELLLNEIRVSLQNKDRTIEDLVASGSEKDKMLAKIQTDLQNVKLAQHGRQTKDEMEKLKAEYDAKLTKTQTESSHSKMKVENLEHYVQTKDAFLKQAQETIGDLRSQVQRLPLIEELQKKFAEQSQALASTQKAKEQAAFELASLKRSKLELEAELKSKLDKVEMLTQAAHIKGNIIKEMQEDQQRQLSNMQENIGYYQKKAKGLENSNGALKQQLLELSNHNKSLQQQLESNQRRLDNMNLQDSEEINRLREEVLHLRAKLQRPGTPRREKTDGGPENDDQSEELLKIRELQQNQVAEGERLNSILGTERQLYNNFIRVLQDLQQGQRADPALEQELEALKLLRAQLADGVRQNDALRAQLRDQLTSPRSRASPHSPASYEGVYQREIQELKSKLEDSERWNASLQARLNELQPRVSGVGGPSGVDNPDAGLGIVSPGTARRLKQQVERLEKQLQQSGHLNVKLKEQLQDENNNTIQSINSKDELVKSQAEQITMLKEQLEKTRQTLGELEQTLIDANRKMELYANDISRLDHDETLMEREHEIEALKLELDELRRTTGNDMAAQTSPSRSWVETGPQEERLRSELAESRQFNEHYKKLLQEKNNEMQRLKRESKSRADSPEKARELQEIQRLRREYENGIKTNSDVRHHLDSEVQATAERSHAAERDSVELEDLRQQLDETLRKNHELRKNLRESLRSVDEVNRLKRELDNTNRANESLGKQLRVLNDSLSRMEGFEEEARKLERELQEAHRLNRTFSDQLKETRRSAEELSMLQRDSRQARLMNERLGHELKDTLKQLGSLKQETERLKRELGQKDKTIETLELRMQSKSDVQSRGASPFHPTSVSTPSHPQYEIAFTQTSPGILGLKSPPQIARLSTSRGEPSSEAPEKVRQLNTTLMGENELLRSKLKEIQRVNANLKDEVERLTQMRRTSGQMKTSSNNDLLASYVAEMRELRVRLEESIRTNDALQAQLKRQLVAQGEKGEGSPARFPDQLIIIRENETLRTEILKRDRINGQLKETIDKLNYQHTKDKEHMDLLRQQLDESSKAMENLQKELRVYEQLYRLSSERKSADVQEGPSYGSEGPRSPRSEMDNGAIALLLAEIRSLRVQLEKSIDTNNALRLKLEEQLSRPLRSTSQSPGKTTVVRQLNFAKVRSEETDVFGEGVAFTGGLPSDVCNHLNIEVTNICLEAERALSGLENGQEPARSLPSIHNIIYLSNKCKAVLERLSSAAESSRGAGDPPAASENKSLRLEIAKLRKRLLLQEDVIKRACERLEETNKTKEVVRTNIIENLTQSETVLKGARERLQNRLVRGSES